MQVNSINDQTTFHAKFLNTQSMHDIVKYAVEHDKFEKLDAARKKIDTQFLRTRISVDIDATKQGFAKLIFRRFVPKCNVIIPKTEADYEISKPIIYEAHTKINPLKYALNKIIMMSNNDAHNKMYKRIVIHGR